MELIFIVKLAAVAVLALLLCYFVLNAVLAFISKFSEQLRKMSKNILVAIGAAYVMGLLVAPEYILGISQPLIRLVGKIVPDFLGI